MTLPAPQHATTYADPAAFISHLAAAYPKLATTFDNLGKDARLVAPTAPADIDYTAFGHIGSFVGGAPAHVRDALWREVGTVAESLAERETPTWISTEGAPYKSLLHSISRTSSHPRIPSSHHAYRHTPIGTGVPWLHVRFDSKPKYIHHRPFRVSPRRGR